MSSIEESADRDGDRSLAGKLNHLFESVRPRGGRPYSNEQVAAAVEQASGVTISQSYIWQLRKAKKDNPTLKHLQALADFFGVPAAYFFDDEVTARVNRQLETLSAEQARRESNQADDQVAVLAMRAGELSPERRKQVMELLDVVYALEQAERRSDTNG
jgi:transcriptional regulator with XRE-family HTH domain